MFGAKQAFSKRILVNDLRIFNESKNCDKNNNNSSDGDSDSDKR